MRGKFFVIEGPDGCGKTTVCHKLMDMLPSENFIFVRDPGSTHISTKIREILIDPECSEMDPMTELLLYLAARNQLVNQTIIPALRQGIHVVSDRYIQSTLAYQLAGNSTKGKGVSRGFLHDLNDRLRHPSADVLFNLSKHATVALMRERLKASSKSADRLESNDDKYFAAVLAQYRQLAEHPTSFRGLESCKKVYDISVLDSADTVAEFIAKSIQDAVAKV